MRTSQKIEHIEVIPVAGHDSMLLNLSGAHAPTFSRIILVITDNSGHEGISETPCSQSILDLLKTISEELLGQSIKSYRSIVRNILQSYQEYDASGRGIQTFDQRTTIHAATAIETALLDLQGKAFSLPVCELLGNGKIRNKVPFLGYLFYVADPVKSSLAYTQEIIQPTEWQASRRMPAMDTPAIVQQAKMLAKTYGFRDFKLKGGVFTPQQEIETVLALREAFPEANLTLDPNGSWSLKEALGAAKQLKGILSYIEDPCGAEGRFSSREIMAEFRQRSGIRTATNMVATDSRELAHAIKLSAVDIPLADPHFWGMEGAVRVARICEDHGLTWGAHSNNHFDISLAMVAHAAAAAECEITAVDTHWVWQDGQYLTQNPPKIQDGQISIEGVPGLGIELDRSAVEQAHALYIASGHANRDDSIAMQDLISNWTFDRKRPCMVR